MGLRDGVAKKILTQLIIKGALGCTTLTLLLKKDLNTIFF